MIMTTEPTATVVTPIKIVTVELTEPLPEISSVRALGLPYQQVRIIVLLFRELLGNLTIPLPESGLTAADVAAHIWQRFATEITQVLQANQAPPVTGLAAEGLPIVAEPPALHRWHTLAETAPFLSVAIATRDRPDNLRRCLTALFAVDYPHYEVIVVDNNPPNDATERLCRDEFGDEPRLRYVCEPAAGVSRARNRGAYEAKSDIVVYVDDDVMVSQNWLLAVWRAFATYPNAYCVTGAVFPAEQETPAQIWFEQICGFPQRVTPRRFDLGAHRLNSPFYPYSAGVFGIGGNMALRKSFLHDLGGFTDELGPGISGLGGGEDLDLYFRVLVTGRLLVYEPAALVYHIHRRTYADLLHQMRAYGRGMTGYLTKCLLDNPLRILTFGWKLPYAGYLALNASSVKNIKRTADYPDELTQEERRGWLEGPWRFVQNRLRQLVGEQSR